MAEACIINSEKEKTTDGIVKKNYSDEEVKAIEILNIYNYTHEDGPETWENIFRSLRDGITKEGMLQLISLACHVQNREGEPLMKGKSSNHRTKTITNRMHLIRAQTRFNARVQESGGVIENDAKKKFKAICYFAACLMRLVTKTPDNFMRALANIKKQYSTLYFDFSPYLDSLKFESSMAEHICRAFRLFPEFKRTIAHHVAFADAEHGKSGFTGNTTFCLHSALGVQWDNCLFSVCQLEEPSGISFCGAIPNMAQMS